MSEDASSSFEDPAEHGTAESDVESDDAQVEPDADAVGRAQGQDEGYAEEQGAEVRARAQDG